MGDKEITMVTLDGGERLEKRQVDMVNAEYWASQQDHDLLPSSYSLQFFDGQVELHLNPLGKLVPK